jgi:hypothetical protein
MKQFWAARTASERRMLILCLIVAVACIPLVLTPPGGGNKKLLSATEASLKLKDATAERTRLAGETERMKPEIENMVFTDAPDQLIPQTIKTLQGYAKQSGLHLREIKPLRMRRMATVTKVPMSVRFTTGDFAKTAVPFLYRVEDPTTKMVIEKFNVTAADPKTRTVDVEAQIALYTKSSGDVESENVRTQ